MRIVYDVRPLQTLSRLRGIGSVTRCVLQALSAIDHANEYTLLCWPGERPALDLDAAFHWTWREVPRLRPHKLGWFYDRVCLGGVLNGLGDCVHFNSPFDLDLGWPHLGPMPPRRVMTLYDLMAVTHARDILRGKQKLLVPVFLQMAANLKYAWRLVSISQTTADEACRVLGLDPAVIRVAPLGVSSLYRPPEDEAGADFRRRHGLSEPYLLYVGGPNPNKNLGRLLAAVREVPEIPSIVMLTRGLPPTDDARVRVLESLDEADLPLLYGSARLLVQPSLFEGFGLPVLEGMACGTPVVCSDIPPLREVGADITRRFPPTDVAAMRDVLRAAWRDDTWLRAAALEGVARAATFTWERCARVVLGVYSEALTA